jgi:hypothetical protein
MTCFEGIHNAPRRKSQGQIRGKIVFFESTCLLLSIVYRNVFVTTVVDGDDSSVLPVRRYFLALVEINPDHTNPLEISD